MSLSLHSLVIIRSGLVSVATFLADDECCFAFVAAFPSLYKIKGSGLTSGLVDSARVLTSDITGDCTHSRHHKTHHQKCCEQFGLETVINIIRIIDKSSKKLDDYGHFHIVSLFQKCMNIFKF